MKKTVIDELIEYCVLNSENIETQSGVKQIVVDFESLELYLLELKETHKQEIIKAYNRGIKVGFNNLFEDAEDYYKETYLNEL
jgi:hypothetical protein